MTSCISIQSESGGWGSDEVSQASWCQHRFAPLNIALLGIFSKGLKGFKITILDQWDEQPK